WAGDRAADPLGDVDGPELGAAGEEHHDLLAAVPDARIVVADAQHQETRDAAKDLVADLVTVLVVDALEVVDVDERAGDRVVRLHAALGELRELVVDVRAREQTGEGIAVRGFESLHDAAEVAELV